MPYRIQQRGEQYCVVKTDGETETMGCHGSRREAQEQQAALYAADAEEVDRSQRQQELARLVLGIMLDLDDEDMTPPES